MYSISKAISLNFSDGTNTIYTRSSQINIPFEVSEIRVANMYLETEGAFGAALNGLISTNLVDSDILSVITEYTSSKPIKHLYNIPRPINGSYDFTINLSNTLVKFNTAGNTRNILNITQANNLADAMPLNFIQITGGVLPHFNDDGSMNSLDYFHNVNGSMFNNPTQVRIIAYSVLMDYYQLNVLIGGPIANTAVYYGYTDKIHIDPAGVPAGVAIDPRAIGNSMATFIEYPNLYIKSIHTDGLPYYNLSQPAIISDTVTNIALSYTIPNYFIIYIS